MEREELLNLLVKEIEGRSRNQSPVRVAIDGRCEAGKTLLARELGAALSASNLDVVCRTVDDFHHPLERRYRQGEYSARGYYEDAYDYPAVVDFLRGPAARNILLFEGIFLFRRELNDYWDFRILLDIDAETSWSRALERDTNVIGPADVTRRKYEQRYEPAWQIYVNEEHPEAKADVIVDNRDLHQPRISFHVTCS
jgi:uridine kinase